MREPSAFLELTIYATVAWLVIRDARVRELFRWSPALPRWLFVGFVGLCILGQLLDTPRRTYPFVSWNGGGITASE